MLLLQYGWTALQHACYSGHTEIVKYLLTNGANLSTTNRVNYKTLLLATIANCLYNYEM